MKAELEASLFARYAHLYADPKSIVRVWGFECGDGWHGIIDKMSALIEAEATVLAQSGVPQSELPQAIQIKEKFGTLRVYVRNANTAALQAIAAAEAESMKTCESCGAPGRLRRGGWLRTLCNSCEAKYRAEAKAAENR